MFEERTYQVECARSWFNRLCSGHSSVVAVPTGAGKTVILCKLIDLWIDSFPESSVIVLSHTQEIVKQDHKALLSMFPPFGCGIYSAGLNRREVKKITVASISSAYRKPRLFKANLVIVDEAHTVNHKKQGMYRKFIDKLKENRNVSVGGMSATVFRTGHGYIHKGDDRLFNDLAYDLTSISAFNKLVDSGYLTKLISKTTEMDMDSTKVKKSAGDYNLKDLAKTHDKDSVTRTAVAETIKYGKNYKKWLIFAIDIDHADNICTELNKQGIKSYELHSRMGHDRETVIEQFKKGSFRALVSVGMVTTGFDDPAVDLIVLLRPTMSSVLHVQMVGRGLRVSPGKSHCLVLDFAGNTERLGPINNPVIPKTKGKGTGEAPCKTCPKCKAITYASAAVCDVCGHKFVMQTKLQDKAGKNDIVVKSTQEWKDVSGVMYSIHSKVGKPDSLKVTYRCGLKLIPEWICLDHTGYAKRKADNWVQHRAAVGMLKTVHSVYINRQLLKTPTKLLLDTAGKYPVIKEVKFT